jgi:pyruvate dehydrogenase (quinone)
MTSEEIRQLVDRAIRTALAERAVTCLILPTNVQELPYEPSLADSESLETACGYARPTVVPPPEDLDAAATMLDAGERVAMLIGQGARGAEAQLLAVADVLGAGIAKALLARDILPDDLPYVTGPLGMLGTKPSSEMMKHCDTLFMIGSSFPYAEFLPKPGQANGIQLDIDPRRLGGRYPMTVSLVGDAKATLAALLPRLTPKRDTKWRARIAGWLSEWWHVMEERARVPANPINPQQVFWELSARLPDNAIITSDSGTVTEWWARDLKLRPGMRATVSGGLATMGCAIPYAIAAKLAYPDRPVIACVGDGAMQMNGMSELLTIARYASEWEDPRFVVLVLDNSELASVTWELRAMQGDPKYAAAQGLPRFDYARYAKLVGFRGLKMEHPSQVAPAWHDALSEDRPVVIDAITDPNVPPLPPHIDLAMLKAFTLSVLRSPQDERGPLLKEALMNIVAR